MTNTLNLNTHWKVGVELELLAPVGSNRYLLAEAIAQSFGDYDVIPMFHYESEPSKIEGQPIFENLTLGFEVLDPSGSLIAKCVDDLTIQHELDDSAAPKPGWFRIVSDDKRFLRLVDRYVDWEQGYPGLLEPLSGVFGAPLQHLEEGLVSLYDTGGDSIFIGAPLPGERERPCELITAPMLSDREELLARMTSLAQTLDFQIPREGALHLHFDAQILKNTSIFKRLVLFFVKWGEPLKTLVKLNPYCKRLGPWDPSLLSLVEQSDFESLSWSEACERLKHVELTKYCDFNLLNLVRGSALKDTFEIRIFRATLNLEEILMNIHLFEALLKAIVLKKDLNVSPSPLNKVSVPSLIGLLESFASEGILAAESLSYWRDRARD